MTAQPQHALTLLGPAQWRGARIGSRTRELLALLVAEPGGRASDADLINAIWPEQRPANPGKALHVVVSRARAATCHEAIVRTTGGYRLGLDPADVDALDLTDLVRQATVALRSGDVASARTIAEQALSIGAPVAGLIADSRATIDPDHTAPHRSEPREPDALAAVRDEAGRQHRNALRTLGLALFAGGDYEAAVTPLQSATAADPNDEAALGALIRSEAATRGPGAGLTRYEDYRRGLADTTGSDPGPELQRIHAELLAADHPVRDGVRFEGTDLLGRDSDLRDIHALLQRARIVSIVGPGGIGKTRLAHALGRSPDQTTAHLVELVGTATRDDVITEVASALEIRDSVASQLGLTTRQRTDMRSRIASRLNQVPTLLILDNCEHVIDGAAELAAFLVANARDLTILTTSRKPLSVAAEHVYPLAQLAIDDASELFCERATAVRPAAQLREDVVIDIVTQLDGLPLAIELAATKVRAMSVEDVAARLEDRFALLRGGDRAAPDRHQTLLAVIDWSWNLLTGNARTALRRMSVFHHGFTLAAAESVLGDTALASIQELVDQSLLALRETSFGVRYSMLETIREFGRMQLVGAGDVETALTAQAAWACEYASRAGTVLACPDQIGALGILRAEEGNLTDVLRRSLARPDPDTAVVLLAALVGYWSVRGEHERVFALGNGVAAAFADYVPSAALTDATRLAMAGIATNWLFIGSRIDHVSWRLLRHLGPESTDPTIAAMTTVILACDPARPDHRDRVHRLCEHENPGIASHALMLEAHELENAGDPTAAIGAIERALRLVPNNVGPWLPTVLRGRLAQLCAQLGRHSEAAAHARDILPMLERLDALDDTVDMRVLLVLDSLAHGRIDDAEQELGRIQRLLAEGVPFMLALVLPTVSAEIAIARGDPASALSTYDDLVATIRAGRLRRPVIDQIRGRGGDAPDSLAQGEAPVSEPWVLFIGAAALAVHALYDPDGTIGADLFAWLANAATLPLRSLQARSMDAGGLDLPALGTSLYALALWGLITEMIDDAAAARIGVIADRFGYNRQLPSLQWRHLADRIEAATPGLLGDIDTGCGDARGAALLAAARDIVIPAFGQEPRHAPDSDDQS